MLNYTFEVINGVTIVRGSGMGLPIPIMVKKLSEQVFDRQLPESPVVAYLAGGAATYLYTGARVSQDVDAEFKARMIRPQVVVIYKDDQGIDQSIHLDQNYNPTLGLMHDDYEDRAVPADFAVAGFKIMLLAPVDLVISKLARFAEHDQSDIQSLVDAGLVDRNEFEHLAAEAINIMIGVPGLARVSVKRVLDMFPPEVNDTKDLFPCSK